MWSQRTSDNKRWLKKKKFIDQIIYNTDSLTASAKINEMKERSERCFMDFILGMKPKELALLNPDLIELPRMGLINYIFYLAIYKPEKLIWKTVKG
jgi:hypothetical protein